MTPAEHLKHLAEALSDIDFYVDTEIVGEDARHICEDVKGALRQLMRLSNLKTPAAHDIRLLDGSSGAGDADAFDLAICLGIVAYAGGVDDIDRYALDLNGLGDLVARGASDRCHDRDIGSGQCIQQGTLADIWLTREHDFQAIAQQRALCRLCDHAVECFA